MLIVITAKRNKKSYPLRIAFDLFVYYYFPNMFILAHEDTKNANTHPFIL